MVQWVQVKGWVPTMVQWVQVKGRVPTMEQWVQVKGRVPTMEQWVQGKGRVPTMEQWVQGVGAYHRAVGAGKGTGAGVDGEMLVEVAKLCESPAARPAHKRTRISVQHRVHLHHSRTSPRISAQFLLINIIHIRSFSLSKVSG